MEINSRELDNHITGHYGEDQYPEERPRQIKPYVEKPPIQAEIIAIGKFRGRNSIDIKMADGRIERNLTAFCIDGGFSDKLQVGTKGKAQYRSGPSYGLWFFNPEVE
jgi:hypothetical protein